MRIEIFKDIVFLASIFLGFVILNSNLLPYLFSVFDSFKLVMVFVSGLFFASFLTVSTSLASFYILGKSLDPIQVALLGGLGAMSADVFLVYVLRSFTLTRLPLLTLGSNMLKVLYSIYYPFLKPAVNLLSSGTELTQGVVALPQIVTIEQSLLAEERKIIRKLVLLFRSSFVRSSLLPIMGVVIIASPFPDEIGLVFLGASNFDYKKIAVIAYLSNTVGIFFIALSAKII